MSFGDLMTTFMYQILIIWGGFLSSDNKMHQISLICGSFSSSDSKMHGILIDFAIQSEKLGEK